MRIYLDIETIPGQAPWVREHVVEWVKPPATLKKAESIAAWEQTERAGAVEEAWQRTSLDGALGQLCVLGWAVDDGPPETLAVSDLGRTGERGVLVDWFAEMRVRYGGTSGSRPTIIGHNVVTFDLAFLWKRAIVHQVKPPFWFPRDPKPWANDVVYDTMTQWAGARNTISLDRLCRALGMDGKNGMTGADVWPAVRDGRLDEVERYCREDIERTRAVYKRMVFE